MSARKQAFLVTTSDLSFKIPNGGYSTCSKCETKVQIAPSSMELIEENLDTDFMIICFECAIPLMQAEDADIQPLTNAQIKEIIDNV